MVLTMKMIIFAWYVCDGRRKVEVRLSAFVFMNKKRDLSDKIYHSGLGQMASCEKDPKTPIVT